jgi:hypothetical protein
MALWKLGFIINMAETRHFQTILGSLIRIPDFSLVSKLFVVYVEKFAHSFISMAENLNCRTTL